jgi:hypothetical protein
MFEIKLKKSKADIYYKSDLQTSKNAWCNISISKDKIFISRCFIYLHSK